MKYLNIYSKLFCCVQCLSLFLFSLPVTAGEATGAGIMLEEKQWVGDLDQLKEKGAIRILVSVSNPDLFIDGFKKYGLAPVIIHQFQEFLNENVATDSFIRTIIIPASRITVMERLVAGYGDLVVANLTVTEERLEKVDFAAPVSTGVKEIIIAAPNSPVLHTLDDLSGKRVFTRSFSSYHEHLLRLNKTFETKGLAPVEIGVVPPALEDDHLLSILGEGLIPYMVLDHRKMELWKEVYSKAVPYPDLAIDTDGEIAWGLRKNSPQLLKLVSDFSVSRQNSPIDFDAVRKSTEKEVLHCYNLTDDKIQKFVQLYPLFVKAAAEYGVDPLVLAALSFGQSEFSEEKVGENDEVGIMQLAPYIEREIDVKSSDKGAGELELHIAAAAKYLAYLRDEKFKDLAGTPEPQMLFAVAAYFDGPEKINEMRWITTKMGKNGNKWFDEVAVTVSRLIGRDSVRAVRDVFWYAITYQMAIESGRIVLPENIELTKSVNWFLVR